MARAIEHATKGRAQGPNLRNTVGRWMDRHAATRRLKQLSDAAGIRMPRMHPYDRAPARTSTGTPNYILAAYLASGT